MVKRLFNPQPMLDRGFTYLDTRERVLDLGPYAGGLTTTVQLHATEINEIAELLMLFVRSDEVPANAPTAYKDIRIGVDILVGETRDLVLGDSARLYEFDTTLGRFFTMRTTNINSRLGVILYPHAVNDTSFQVRAIISRFAIT